MFISQNFTESEDGTDVFKDNDCATRLSYLKAVFELLADKVQGNGIDAGIEGSHVDPNVIHHQQEAVPQRRRVHIYIRVNRTRRLGEQWGSSSALPEQLAAVGVILVVDSFFQNATEMERQPAQGEDQHQAEDRLGHLPPLQGWVETDECRKREARST